MGKVTERTPSGLLLLAPELVKDSLVIQCPHISINISGKMGMAATRVAIATPSHLETRTRPQFIAGWTVATMSAQKFGVER